MWDGEEQQLALTEPEQHNAIHGLVRWLGWRVAAVEPDRVTFTCTSYPQPGYQWPLDIDVSYQLSDDGLAVTTGITNRGTSPAPVAAGAHPYLRAGTDRIDDCDLVIPANQWLPTGEQQIPTGVAPVESSPYDFRSARPIGDTKIDYAFADLRRGSDGRAAVVLRNRAGGHTTSLWVDESYGWIEVFTGDALPNPARRRQGLGVEPMTAPPNAFATGEGLITLTPQERWQGQWGIRAS
jgi:aldose 1-epimerase